MKQLLTQKDLIEMGIGSRTKVWGMVKNNQFPQPIKYGRFNRWYSEAVHKWMEERHQQAQQAQ